MRILALFLLIFPAFLPQATAQVFERSLPVGFNVEPQVLHPAGTGGWLVAGRGVRQPGDLYTDSLFVVLFDQQADMVKYRGLSLPVGERHYFYDALATSDGGFAVAFETTLCDVAADQTTLRKIGADGQTVWEYTGGFGAPVVLPQWLREAPDGNILGVSYDRITKYDLASGNVLWTAPLNVPDLYLADIYFLPGTEDFIAVGFPVAQRWEQSGPTASPVYTLTQSNSPDSTYLHQLAYRSDSIVYGFNALNNGFYRIDPITAQVQQLPVSLPFFSVLDFAASPGGLLVLGRDGPLNRLVEYHVNGDFLASYPMPDQWLLGRFLAVQDSAVAVAGVDISGPDGFYFDDLPNWFAAANLWFRTMTGPADQPAQPPVDAAVTAVQQQTPVEVDTMIFPGSPAFYTLSGGNFKVQVTNHGDETLDEVYVNTRFGPEVVFPICFHIPAQQRRFTGLNLASGASAWLDFGDIDAPNQGVVPLQFCFWTTAPELRPDADHANDEHCFSYTTPVAEPNLTTWRLYPNPAFGSHLQLAWPREADVPLLYEIFDAAGRRVRTGALDQDQNPAPVSIEGLPTGLYWVKAGSWRGRVVVQQ